MYSNLNSVVMGQPVSKFITFTQKFILDVKDKIEFAKKA